MHGLHLQTPRKRGAILINVLAFVVIISIVLAGMGQLMISDYSIVKVENNYANSLAVAEAGVNYELRKITTDAATADQKKSTGAPGTSYTTAAGTFQIYVTQRNNDGTETTPWTPGQNLWIYSSGGVSGLTRTIKVAAVPYNSNSTSGSNYGVFGVTEGIINGYSLVITGDVGTNGGLIVNGSPTITGSIIFNGSAADWEVPPNKTYKVVRNANAVAWPTVEAIAISTFGATGLTYVAAHNDNALASPAIVNNQISTNGSSKQTFVGKAGGANYYLTSLMCNGTNDVVFNNSAGPITIWLGPSGSSGNFTFNGGTAGIKMTTDPAKPVRIYLAITTDVILNGSGELDAGIYNINNAARGKVIFNGSPAIYGMMMGNSFIFNGTPTVTAVLGYFNPTGSVLYYGCVQPWTEIGGVN